MCLYVNHIKTEKELENRASRIFYKIFIRASDYLSTPYWSFRVDNPGKYTLANAVSYTGQEMIGKGVFHARTRKSALKQDLFYCEFFECGKPVVVPIHADIEDILAFGVQDDVALRTFTITKETWDSTFPGGNGGLGIS